MKIGNKEVEEIIVTDENSDVLADISDDDIIYHEEIKVILIPSKTNPDYCSLKNQD